MKYGRYQCKDLPNFVFVMIVEAVPGYWRHWDDVLPIIQDALPGVPDALIFAKMDRLDDQGIIHACVHRPFNGPQCRGDIHLPSECRGC